MDQTTPTRTTVLKMIDDLRSGAVGRSDVARWAMEVVDDDRVRMHDQVVMRTLKRLGAVDLPAPDRDYLYTEADFDDWRAEMLGN